MTNKPLSWVEIDTQAIKYNLKNLKSLLRKRTRFMVVVKSNAYGHGLVKFAHESIKNGADWLGVVTIDEALKLREAKIIKPIMVLGYIPIDRLKEASQQHIIVPITSMDYIAALIHSKIHDKITVHLKIETGTNRMGIKPESILGAYNTLSKLNNIKIEGIYSHLASVEENNMNYTASQFGEFGKTIKLLEKNNIKIPLKHIAASGATMILPESHFDMVRCGIAAYGLWPSQENKTSFWNEADSQSKKPFLKPVLSYKTQLVQVKAVRSGYVSYGCTYRVKKTMRIGVLPIGYYEGLDRGLSAPMKIYDPEAEQSGFGEVLVDGIRCPIIGRICMNMTIIDVSKIKAQKARIGEEVIIIGKQGRSEITVEEVAKKINTINYEIITRIPEHIPRIYI